MGGCGHTNQQHLVGQYIQFSADGVAGMGNYYERDRRRTAAHHLVGGTAVSGAWHICDLGLVHREPKDEEI